MNANPLRRALVCRAALAAGLVLWSAAAAPASGLPERFEALFTLRARGVDIGRTHWQLAPAGGGRYVYESHSETVGLAKLLRDERIEERSVWRFADGGGVRPLRYSYSRSGKREREVEVRFDWDRGRVHNTLNGESWTMPVENGTLDKLVYLLALMRDLGAGVRDTRYTVADGGKVKTYRMRVLRTERIDTALGALDALVVERRREGDDERLTLVWCAPALRYLPVRVEHRERDGTVYLELESVEGIALDRVEGIALERVEGIALESVEGIALERVEGIARERVEGIAPN